MDNLYHGTTRSNAEIILSSQFIKPSAGDRHWLGDGVYFYKEDIMAYNWCFYEYRKTKSISSMEEINPDEIYKNHSILLVKTNIESERIFDLNLVEHQIVFAKCIENLKEKKPFENNNSYAEGLILNLMFNELGFNEKFDMVIGNFYKKEYPFPFGKKRIPIITEQQICIKKENCIKSIADFNYKEKISSYNDLLGFINNNKYNYVSKRKYKYKTN